MHLAFFWLIIVPSYIRKDRDFTCTHPFDFEVEEVATCNPQKIQTAYNFNPGDFYKEGTNTNCEESEYIGTKQSVK
ncbi:hypothetical protein D3C77_740920 [compost metagenome]